MNAILAHPHWTSINRLLPRSCADSSSTSCITHTLLNHGRQAITERCWRPARCELCQSCVAKVSSPWLDLTHSAISLAVAKASSTSSCVKSLCRFKEPFLVLKAVAGHRLQLVLARQTPRHRGSRSHLRHCCFLSSRRTTAVKLLATHQVFLSTNP